MLDDQLVYTKTALGAAEIGTRSGTVPLATRRVLILIDGRRTLAELVPLVPGTDVGSIVQQLEAQGLVQLAGRLSAFAPAATSPAGIEEPAEDRTGANFEALKRRALRDLTARLGADAEVMGARIEQARTIDDLRQRLHEAERLVAALLGDAQSQDFLRALRRR
jgi:hypothetical protein